MSLRGPEQCPCCGKEESTSGCVRGHTCGCSYYDFRLSYNEAMCARCEKCKKHCQCKEGLLTRAESVRLKLEAAGLPPDHDPVPDFPELVNWTENYKPHDYRAGVLSLAKLRTEKEKPTMPEKTDWKAISIQQPWSHLIVQGYKDIENRSRPTSFRGHVLIHAGKNIDDESIYVSEGKLKMFTDFKRVLEKSLTPEDFTKFTTTAVGKWHFGGIVGIAEIVDCVTTSTSPWFFGKYGYVLRNARPLPFVPCRGQLGFFDVPPEVIEQLKAEKAKAKADANESSPS